MSVAFKMNSAYRSLDSFVDRENDPRCTAILIDGIDAKLNANVIVAVALINLDHLLARFLEKLLVDRLVDFQFDFFAEPFWLDSLGSIDFDFAYDRTRLHRHGHLHPVAFRLREDANVENRARPVE